MSRLRQALAARRQCRQRLQHHLHSAQSASRVLRHEYRRYWPWALGGAAAAGFALSGSQRWRPPRSVLRAAFHWSMIVLRGLL